MSYYNENMIIYAFRYALTRKTYAVADCVEYLEKVWHKLPAWTQEQIKNDIVEENRLNPIDFDGISIDDCYRKEWKRIFMLKTKEK